MDQVLFINQASLGECIPLRDRTPPSGPPDPGGQTEAEKTMPHRIINFNAGPAALPLEVLNQIKEDLPDFGGSGMSVLEISHRSPIFDGVVNQAVERVKSLLNLGDDHMPLFIQGGASLQFAMAPMNLCGGKRPAYLNTGTWSNKALAQAQKLGFDPIEAASSEADNFCRIPKGYKVPEDAAYLYLVSNNTIKGTQIKNFPEVTPPLVCDMSSDMLSRPFDPAPFGLIFAGAQKNLGPAGVVLAIIRKDMLDRPPHAMTPDMLNYNSYAAKNSLYNTPPCFAIYVVNLVLGWIQNTVGGLEAMAKRNQAKADLLYGCMDKSGGFYRPTADKEDRSFMNVTFRLADESLEQKFVAEALKNGLGGLKGHRSVGGCRASIYNALEPEEIQTLVSFMEDFAGKNG